MKFTSTKLDQIRKSAVKLLDLTRTERLSKRYKKIRKHIVVGLRASHLIDEETADSLLE